MFGGVEELKEKLEELRNSTLLVFALSNLIWIILLLTITHQENLKVLGTNVIGFAFLAIYGFIIVIQFLTLLWHRMATFFHVVARASWERGALHMVWKFDDRDLLLLPVERTLEPIRQQQVPGCGSEDELEVAELCRRLHIQDGHVLLDQGSVFVSVTGTSDETDL